MKCPKCQFENPVGAKFCNGCGNRLQLICEQCGNENAFGSKFCNECGKRLEVASADKAIRDTEGERKHVTVLFSDLSGYTAMSEKLDPEEVKEVISRIFGEIAQVIAKYEGFIEKFVGDAVMALFGVPKAHEDDPVRAIRAAREIHDLVKAISPKLEQQVGQPLAMHSGINTGLVVSSEVDVDRGTHGVVGDTLNLASRLADMAAPGEILLSPQTHELTSPYFETRPLETVRVKGKAKPIIPYLVVRELSVQTRFDAAERRGFTAFTGREEELATLHSCFKRAAAGNGQFVTVVGEAGVGKSRLIYEFRHSLDRNKITVLEGRCQSYARDTPYFSLINALRRGLRLREEDTPGQLLEKSVANILAIDQALEQYLPLYLHLLSIPSEEYPLPKHLQGQELKNAFQDALAAINVLNSKRQPMVLILEDWHWVDEASDSALRHFVSVIAPYSLMVVVIYRPEVASNWGNWSYHTPIVLKPLDSSQTDNIVKSVWRVGQIPEGLAPLIHDRTGGNPFFIEEICHALTEEGTIQVKDQQAFLIRSLKHLSLPDTVQAVIRARLDRLDRNARESLRLASVIGREFTRRILERISTSTEQLSESLEILKAFELIQQIRVVPEASYLFKHVLTQEVTYDTLLLQKRKELHRLIGLAIEELYPDRLVEQYEVLAHHFSKGEEWDRAFDYLIRAAQKATKAFATREAVALYDQALEATDHLGEDVETKTLMMIHQAKVELYAILSDFERARAEGERLLGLARRVGDRVNEGSALARMASASYWAHDFDRALEYSRGAIEVATLADAKQVLAAAHFTAGTVHAMTGRLTQAEEELTRSFNISQSVGDVVHQTQSLIFVGFLKNWEGKFDEALRVESKALRIAREHNLMIPLLRSLFGCGLILTGKGDYDEALSAFEEGLQLSEKVGDEFYGYRFLNSLGWLYSELGDLDRAIELNRLGAEGGRKRGDPEAIANAEINLGDIFLTKNDMFKAHEFLDGVNKLVMNPATTDWMKWRYSIRLFASLGELWLACGEPSKAREFDDLCLELATRTNSQKYLVRGQRLKGEIALASGKLDEAENAMRQALIMGQAIGNPTQLWRTYAALARLRQEQGDTDEAYRAHGDALSVIEKIATSLQNQSRRDTFIGSHPVQEIRQKFQIEDDKKRTKK